jgi:histidinol-phosphate aminotransferase
VVPPYYNINKLLCVPVHCCVVLQVGCGADELIDLLMRCVLDPGDAIVDCPPTFTMYAFDADVNDARVITVPRLEGFKTDVQGIK